MCHSSCTSSLGGGSLEMASRTQQNKLWNQMPGAFDRVVVLGALPLVHSSFLTQGLLFRCVAAMEYTAIAVGL